MTKTLIHTTPSLLSDPFFAVDDIFSLLKNKFSNVNYENVGFPKINMYESAHENKSIMIQAAVAGWEKGDITVEVKDGGFIISADKQHSPDGWTRIYSGAKTSAFKTFVQIPYYEEYDLNNSSAWCEDGMLYIKVPRKKEVIDRENGIKLEIM